MMLAIQALLTLVPMTAVAERSVSPLASLIVQVLYLGLLAGLGIAIYLGGDYLLGGRQVPELRQMVRRSSNTERSF
jgi:hypothetical protein